jgi:hypothetical protein
VYWPGCKLIVGVVTVIRAGLAGIRVSAGARVFSLSLKRLYRFWAAEPFVEWISEAFTLVLKWRGREADHSPPSSGKVKNKWS